MSVIQHMQSLIAQINDVPIEHNVCHFLLTHADALSDEQVLVAETEEGAELGVYIDPVVLDRLSADNPFEALTHDNLADFCTALEGVSHFQYLAWCMSHGRSVSLIELELQAEVDKYTIAQWLLMQQSCNRFPHGLHAKMFSYVSFVDNLEIAALRRYQEVNRLAAGYCEYNDRRYLRRRSQRVDQWIRELRAFYRCSHHTKLRRSLH